MSDLPSLLHIKGLRDGLLITLDHPSWDEACQELLGYVREKQSFFQGARLALDVGVHVLKVADLTALRDQLSEKGISLWAVLSASPVTENTAQLLGLATRVSRPHPQEFVSSSVSVSDETALWLGRTLRSGTRVEFPGHVVVWGDVNPGAEIVAGGNILVWGRVRGSVHAGAQGDQDAVIAALELAPTQARIADESFALSFPKGRLGPKKIVFKDACLVVEDWQTT